MIRAVITCTLISIMSAPTASASREEELTSGVDGYRQCSVLVCRLMQVGWWCRLSTMWGDNDVLCDVVVDWWRHAARQCCTDRTTHTHTHTHTRPHTHADCFLLPRTHTSRANKRQLLPFVAPKWWHPAKHTVHTNAQNTNKNFKIS